MSSRSTVRVELRILGQPVVVETPQPPDRIRLDEALPLLQDIDNSAVGLAVEHARSQGKTVSCRDGCAACCKAQPVPITPPEAFALWRLVETSPSARRADLRSRFADRVARLREAGLADMLLGGGEGLTEEQAQASAKQYHSLRLSCPFLENDSCSIYQHRPFVCRQYLVTSPPELCRDPFTNSVEVVPMPIAAAGAALRMAESFLGTTQPAIPLTLALEYAAKNRDDLDRKFSSREVLGRALQELARSAHT
jgi:Fe-S-cluster containining protein